MATIADFCGTAMGVTASGEMGSVGTASPAELNINNFSHLCKVNLTIMIKPERGLFGLKHKMGFSAADLCRLWEFTSLQHSING